MSVQWPLVRAAGYVPLSRQKRLPPLPPIPPRVAAHAQQNERQKESVSCSFSTPKSLPGKAFEEPLCRASRNPIRKPSIWVNWNSTASWFQGASSYGYAEGEATRQRRIKGTSLYTGFSPLFSRLRRKGVLQELTALTGFGCERRKENPKLNVLLHVLSLAQSLGMAQIPKGGLSPPPPLAQISPTCSEAA